MKLAVVVPSFNVEDRIVGVLHTMPSFVDWVVVVDDASVDRTFEVATSFDDEKVTVIRHAINRGVGAAIVTGYHCAVESGADVVAVMAGDGQMHPDDLLTVVTPVLHREADYVKGNRFCYHDTHERMPILRQWGTRGFARMTRWAANLDQLDDSQCGYTAISAKAIRKIDLNHMWPRYGYPNDLIGRIALAGMKIKEVPVRAVYAGEKSGLRPWHALTISMLIGRVAVRRWVHFRRC